MTIAPIINNQWQSLNEQGSHKSQANFAAALERASAGDGPALKPLELPHMNPLSQSDFAGGNPALASEQSSALAPLNAHDFGSPQTADLKPLSATDFIPGAKTSESREAQIDKQTRKWVSETFYGSLLKQMRNSPFKSKIFDGGRGAEAFSPLLDQQLADHIGAAKSNKLVRAIVNDIARKTSRTSSPVSAGSQARATAGSPNATSPIPAEISPYENLRYHVPANR